MTKHKALSRYDLYTLCAQNPQRDARLLLGIWTDGLSHLAPASSGKLNRKPAPKRQRKAITLGEDFSAAAALANAWCRLGPEYHAVAVDIDPQTHALAQRHRRLTLVESDVLKATHPADLIAATNFGVCELHSRARLVKYLKQARSRLKPGGAFICDIYGGSDAYFSGIIRQDFRTADGRKVRYQWEQRTADPLTGMVTNAMHFSIAADPRSTSPALRMKDAFVYHWRLWSVPELRQAMLDAGFASTDVYPRTPGAMDQHGDFYISPIISPDELGDGFNVFVVARVGATA